MTKESKHVKGFTSSHLKAGESVVATTEGYIGEAMGKGDKAQHNGALIVTEGRLAFYRKGFLGEVLETMELSKITSIERKSTLGHRVIRLHTSHDQLEFKTFDKAGEARVIEAIEAGRSGGSEKAIEPAPASAGHDDPLQAIERLAELKEKGILTEEEFQAKKASLLEKV